MIQIGFKRCTKCGEIKGLGEFSKDTRNKDGLTHQCLECIKIYNQKNRQKRSGQARQRRQKKRERNLSIGITITKKSCSKCGKIKNISEFHKDFGTKDGLKCWCKDCARKPTQEYYQRNKTKIIQDKITKEQENKKRNKKEGIIIKEKCRAMCKQTKSAIQFYKDYRSSDGLSPYCIICGRKRSRQYYKQNKTKERARVKKYQQTEAAKIKRRKYVFDRYHSDPMFKLNHCVSSSIYHDLKSKGISKKGRHWETLVNFVLKQLKTHIESLWEPGMSWDNYGRGKDNRVIDHKIPKAAFNFTSPDDPEFKQCWALSNLQPLWDIDNLQKQAKIINFDGDK